MTQPMNPAPSPSLPPAAPPRRVANARMYSVAPAVRDAWRELLQWVLTRAGLGWDVIDYDPPAPLSGLWARDDLGLVTMCGLPFSQCVPRPTLVAAPVPAGPRYGGRPVYFTDIVVRASSPHQSLEDTFGGVLGYTLVDSMSGGLALGRHLAPYREARGGRLYRAAVGQLLNARGVIDALAAGTIDVGPLDSYYFALLQRHDPDFAEQVRVIASTQAMPIPPFIATAPLEARELHSLRQALLAVGSAPQLRALRTHLLLDGFAIPEPADYDILAQIARQPLPIFEEL